MIPEQTYRTDQPVSSAPERPSGAMGQVAELREEASVSQGHWRRTTRMLNQEWAPSALFLMLDVLCWVLIQGFTSLVRGDSYYSSPFVFFVIDVLQVSVIVTALFTIGGYDRNTETRGLVYTTEHILAMIVAGTLSAVLIYSAATFDQTMKPSRGVLLFSFIVFLPVSLVYRRWVRSRVSATIANRAFLVIGSGEMAMRFYEQYKKSINRQRLEFVDTQPERIGRRIAGAGSPMVEGDMETKLERLGANYSGVILAEPADRIPPYLVDRLIRTQFQRTRVYTSSPFTNRTGAMCRWRQSIRSGHCRPAFNWRALPRITI